MNYPYYGQQQYMYQPQQYMRQDNTPPAAIKGRPVSSIDEVRAIAIDFDGSVFFFPDIANKKIYTKQINIDGTATLNTYELQLNKTGEEPIYVTKEEFDKTIEEISKKLAAPQVSKTDIKF